MRRVEWTWVGVVSAALATVTLAMAANLDGQPRQVESQAAAGGAGAAASVDFASPEQATRWLDDLQQGRDTRHQQRPESTRSASRAVSASVSAPTDRIASAKAALSTAADGSDRAAFQEARDQLASMLLLENRRFDRQAAQLKQLRAWPKFSHRLERARSRIKSGLETRIQRADELLANWNTKAAEQFSTESAVAGDDERLILGTAPSLPLHRLSAAPLPLSVQSSVTPAYAANPAPQSNAGDLADTADAPLHDEISAKAAELGYEYTRILDFVRESVRTEWYPGSQRGALGALRARAGNDVDQASLLIALLRAANVPARYVHGTAQLSIAELESMFNLQGAPSVLKALNRSLRSHRTVTIGGAVAAVDLELTWVSAELPFANYRGTAIQSRGRTWLPLAPSVKPHSVRPAALVLRTMAYDINALLQNFLTTEPGVTPLEKIRADVTQFLVGQAQSGDYSDQLAQVHPTEAALELLPTSLPFTVGAVDYEGALLPAFLQPELDVKVSDASGTVRLLQRLPVAHALGQRVTLSFQAASAADQNVINGFGGGLSVVPPYLIELRPQLVVAGQVLAVGDPIPAAQMAVLEVSVRAGDQSNTARQRITAGAMATLVLSSGSGPATPETEGEFIPTDSEPPAARVLSNFVRNYAQQWQADGAELAALIGVTIIEPLPAITLALTQMDVTQVEGVPTRLSLDSIALDAAARTVDAISADGSLPDEADWFVLTALHGSYLEHQVFEQQWAVPAVSADRLLARTVLSGLPVLDLQGAAGSAVVSGLAHPIAVKDELLRWLGQGYRVRVPQAETSIDNWRGSAWVVDGPEGSSGYFLSGAIAGGLTIIPPELWFLPNLGALFSNPYGPTPNSDPLDVYAVKLFEDSQGQIGDVDTDLETPLRARVEDSNGRPVAQARVHFKIESGDGGLVSDSGGQDAEAIALTDRAGVAEVVLKLGTHATQWRFLTEEGAEKPQRMLVNQVSVVAESRLSASGVEAGERYLALARPGDVDRIVIVARPNYFESDPGQKPALLVGFGFGTFRYLLEDEFGNLVGNAPINISKSFSAPSAADQCPEDMIGAYEGGLFLPGSCPSDVPILTGNPCGSNYLSTRSSPGANTVYVIPPNVGNADFRITISSGGVSLEIPTLVTGGVLPGSEPDRCVHAVSDYDFVFGHFVYDPASGQHVASGRPTTPQDGTISAMYDLSQTIEAAKPNEWLPVPRRVFLARASSDPLHPEGALSDWIIGLPQFRPDLQLSYSSPMVIQADAGAEVNGPYLIASGVYEYNVRMPGGTGRIGLTGYMYPDSGGDLLEYVFPPVWSISPELAEGVPSPVPLGNHSELAVDVGFHMSVDPEEYRASGSNFSIDRDGISIGVDSYTGPLNQLYWSVTKGLVLDQGHAYSVKASINDDTPYRVETERRALTSSTDLIIGVAVNSGSASDVTDNQAVAQTLIGGGSTAHVARDIDISARRGCAPEGELFFTLARRAQVSVDFFSIDASGSVSPISSGQLIDNEWFDAGS